MNVHNRTAVLGGAVLVGAATPVLINVLTGRMFFGFDNALGALSGGLIGMGAGAVIVLGNHQFRLTNSLGVAFLWCFLVHLLNVVLGWTSHGLTVESTLVSVVLSAAIGTAAWVCGHMNLQKEDPDSGVERGIVFFALAPVCAASLLAVNFYDQFQLFGHQPDRLVAFGVALGVLAWVTVLYSHSRFRAQMWFGGAWMMAYYVLVVMLLVGPDFDPSRCVVTFAWGLISGACIACTAHFFPAPLPTVARP